MQKQTLALVIGAVLLTGAAALAWTQFGGADEVPLVQWNADDEVSTVQDPETETGELASAEIERTAVEIDENGAPIVDDGGDRVAVIVRGRVVDKYGAPVQDADVFLEHSRSNRRRGGNRRRIPEPVRTDRDGQFAFAGNAFANLRVSLQVRSKLHAPGIVDRDIGDVRAKGQPTPEGIVLQLEDVVLQNGGEVVGRVTDFAGNGIANATIRPGAQGRNRWRWMRNRDEFVTEVTTDNNGYYSLAHLPAGDWNTAATAKRHTEGRSATFEVVEDQRVEVEDIQLGPGFELTGIVRDPQGAPVAKARVTARSTGGRGERNGQGGGGRDRGRGGRERGGRDTGRGGPFGGGRSHSTTTNERGEFTLEHLPGVTMRLEVRAEDYLNYEAEDLDPTVGQPIYVTLQTGLRIAGVVLDGVDNQPVTTFAIEARRVRGLPVPGAQSIDLNAIRAQLRDGNLDEATRNQLRQQMRDAREAMEDQARRNRNRGGDQGGDRGGDRGGRGRGGRGGWGGFGGPTNIGKPERHADGQFVLTGLQEGVYEVRVQSPDHAFFTSAEVELRQNGVSPSLTIRLDRGLYFAGVVFDDSDRPIVGAEVELRAVDQEAESAAPAGGRGDRGRGGDPRERMMRAFMAMGGGNSLRLQTKTNEDGEFFFTHVPAGRYRVSVEADGFAEPEDQTFALDGDRSDGKFVMGPLGRLVGEVTGLAEGEFAEAEVTAMMVPEGGDAGSAMFRMFGRGGPKQSKVQSDGSYVIEDLEPGSYIVRAYVGSRRDIMRQLMPQFMTGELLPDLRIEGGETAERDLQVLRAEFGTVRGTVMHNGEPAQGFRVELRAVDSGTSNGANGPGGRDILNRMRGGRFGGGGNAEVKADGTFEMDRVNPGQYTLRVTTRQRSTVHEEPVFVAINGVTEQHVTVFTSRLTGTVVAEDDTDPKSVRASVSLLQGVTTLPENLGQWMRTPGNRAHNARIRDGAFEFESVPPGTYLMVVRARDHETTTQTVSVGSGDNAVTGTLGKATPAGTGQPNGNGGR